MLFCFWKKKYGGPYKNIKQHNSYYEYSNRKVKS